MVFIWYELIDLRFFNVELKCSLLGCVKKSSLTVGGLYSFLEGFRGIFRITFSVIVAKKGSISFSLLQKRDRFIYLLLLLFILCYFFRSIISSVC